MKGKSLLQCLLAAAVASLIIALPFMGSSGSAISRFTYQVRLASSTGGMVQVFYDLGRGFNETDSTRVDITAGEQPTLLNFSLPPGVYRALRFDPLDREATLTFSQARILSPSGRVIKTFAPRDFDPANQIAQVEIHDESLTIVTTPGANDPFLRVALPAPLRLEPPWSSLIAPVAKCYLPFLVAAVALLLALQAAPAAWRGRWAGRALRVWQRSAPRPVLTIALAAAAAVIASSYPVVFLGRSFVSPNYGTRLLYEHFPTLPDSTDGARRGSPGRRRGRHHLAARAALDVPTARLVS